MKATEPSRLTSWSLNRSTQVFPRTQNSAVLRPEAEVWHWTTVQGGGYGSREYGGQHKGQREAPGDIEQPWAPATGHLRFLGQLLAAWSFPNTPSNCPRAHDSRRPQNLGLSSLALASDCRATPRNTAPVSFLERTIRKEMEHSAIGGGGSDHHTHGTQWLASLLHVHTHSGIGLGGHGRQPGMQSNTSQS